MENKSIWDKLNNHEQRITQNTDDINDIKVDTGVQGESIKNLNNSIKSLTSSTNKLTEQIEDFLISNGNKNSDNWKWAISVILIPVILYLLKLIK